MEKKNYNGVTVFEAKTTDGSYLSAQRVKVTLNDEPQPDEIALTIKDPEEETEIVVMLSLSETYRLNHVIHELAGHEAYRAYLEEDREIREAQAREQEIKILEERLQTLNNERISDIQMGLL
jgi:hypothetical protein